MAKHLNDIVRGIRSLDPFPNVATSVLEVAGRKDVVPDELVEVIRTDPGLTGKVLKLCNSAYYGFQREIATISEAGNRLGVNALVSLVVTSCTTRYFRRYGDEDATSAEDLWKRCVSNGLAARLVAKLHGECDPEVAYTAGLLQDMGNIVLSRFLISQKPVILEEARRCGSLLEAEHQVLGITHAELGARLAAHWKLPERLIDTIRFHHTPERATVDPVLTGTAHLAETVSWAIGNGADLDGFHFDVSGAALALTGLDVELMQGLDSSLESALSQAENLLAA